VVEDFAQEPADKVPDVDGCIIGTLLRSNSAETFVGLRERVRSRPRRTRFMGELRRVFRLTAVGLLLLIETFSVTCPAIWLGCERS
jgi:hypothetical protein